MSIKVLNTEPKEIAQEAIRLLRLSGYEVIGSDMSSSPEEIQGIFIRNIRNIGKEYLDQFPNLRFILVARVGIDDIDLKECARRNIQVFNAPGSNANAVAEFILMIMLMLLRKIPQQIQLISKNEWRNLEFAGAELQGKVVGLIGCGAIGKKLASKLQSFGVALLGYDPYIDAQTLEKYTIKKCELNELLQQADIISLQLVLTAENREMFTEEQFSRMKKNCYFINTARGELIKEDDLIKALTNNIISGAALDVFQNEPNINKDLLKIPNLVLTPHIAWCTEEANLQMSVGAVENFLKNLKETL